jgi:hypothetical protein
VVGLALHGRLVLENLIRALVIFNGFRSSHYQRAFLGYHSPRACYVRTRNAMSMPRPAATRTDCRGLARLASSRRCATAATGSRPCWYYAEAVSSTCRAASWAVSRTWIPTSAGDLSVFPHTLWSAMTRSSSIGHGALQGTPHLSEHHTAFSPPQYGQKVFRERERRKEREQMSSVASKDVLFARRSPCRPESTASLSAARITRGGLVSCPLMGRARHGRLVLDNPLRTSLLCRELRSCHCQPACLGYPSPFWPTRLSFVWQQPVGDRV